MQPSYAYLVLHGKQEWTNVFRLEAKKATSLGRSSKNTITLNDDRCSREHARIIYDQGQWILQDTGSRNGTFLNDQLIEESAPLQTGDDIRLGHTVLRFTHNLSKLFSHSQKEASNASTAFPESGSGIYGLDAREGLQGPGPGDFDPTTVIHSKSQSGFLVQPPASRRGQEKEELLGTTCRGYDSADLCRLAFVLAKNDDVETISELAIQGLLEATGADAGGVWLLPHEENHSQRADQLKLVASISNTSTPYLTISRALASEALSSGKGMLVDSNQVEKIAEALEDELDRTVPLEPHRIIVAPIQAEPRLFGLLHLYSEREENRFQQNDLEYALAVAETVATALGQCNRAHQLQENLNQARSENTLLREILDLESEIVGTSDAIRHVENLAAKAAGEKSTVLIRGESGVGKELVARAIHFSGPRREQSFICLNCAALSETLLSSELFGHEKGAFTGATDQKKGKFEAAHQGTLFLDEIGEMSINLQSKFLRVLEGHPFERVGGNQPISVDVRVIAATNRDLEQEVAEKRFRHDLFFRLRVLEIVVPPLRRRPTDIPLLANHFLKKLTAETGRKDLEIEQEALERLMEHRWPGNVRELKNVMERAIIMANGRAIQAGDLILSSLETTGDTDVKMPASHQKNSSFVPKTLHEMEKEMIKTTLEYVEGNKSRAARLLGIERSTLDRKIKRWDIAWKDSSSSY
jgi:Nif-specific regulatory protein